jgi:Family of unknown function (DUF6519)/Right handed beta helix region
MSGDYTRVTFNSLEDHAGVFMQQGRVLLDADFNELVELIDRRWRAETVDIIGRCVVPKETPDGFKIGISGGMLRVGRGRIYAHGLLVENHGTGPLEFDPVLAEVRGTQAIPYNQQPYLPNAPALPATGTHLVYVDVWQREVTALQEPDLLEKAVGVDTATRLQTVWQVKVHRNDRGVGLSCSTPDDQIPGWLDLISPSAGRLTTAAVGAPTSDDPCIISPNGGYRGRGNHLYRVEIHNGGAQGVATFKWSRDNASVATNITALNPSLTKLTVVRKGRDAVLRFQKDDWVEVTDDRREFAGQPGIMRKIASVDDVTQTITLASALPPATFDATDRTRHLRVIRWDQKGPNVDANNGVLTVPAVASPATTIILEDGVQISFTAAPVGGQFRVADYWSFAARTADASVEELNEAPPRGIHHHYCRLAIVNFPSNVTDCRTLWPPEFGGAGCDCTVCVSPESHNSGTLTIQKAIDQVKATGGKVCLEPGRYNLGQDPIRIIGAKSMHLKGHGWKTQLFYQGGGEAIRVENSLEVTLERFTLLTLPGRLSAEALQTMGPAIALLNSLFVTVEKCNVLHFSALLAAQAQALSMFSSATISRPPAAAFQFVGQPAIGIGGILIQTKIDDNLLLGTVGIGSLAQERLRTASTTGLVEGGGLAAPVPAASTPSPYLITYDFIAERNLMVCLGRGIGLTGSFAFHVGETRLAENSIYGCLDIGILARSRVLSEINETLTLASRLDIKSNILQTLGHGIVVTTDETRICDNDIATIRFRQVRGLVGGVESVGIGVASENKDAIERCQILGNRVLSVPGHGIYLEGNIASAMIKQNFVSKVGGSGIFMEGFSRAQHLSIENNQLLNIAPQTNIRGQSVMGIGLVGTAHAEVVGNTIIGVGAAAVQNLLRAGIAVAASASVRIAGNEIADIGPEQFIEDSVGINIISPFTRVDVVDNVVRRNQNPRTGTQTSTVQWYALRIRELPKGATPFVEAFTTPVVGRSASVTSEAVFVPGELIFVFLAPNKIFTLPRGEEIVSTRGNLLESYFSRVPVVELTGNGANLFSDNRCLLKSVLNAAGEVVTGAAQAPEVVFINAGAIIASNNYIEGPGRVIGMKLFLPATTGKGFGPFTVLGNITSGAILVNNQSLPDPWKPLNVEVP